MREPFLQKLEKRALVCDGAMGTMLYAKGVPFSRCFDELNLSLPQAVKEVHLAYIKAGAEVIETNTFGASRPRLGKFDLGDKVREINLAGARLAREVAGDGLYVAGSVGPLGIPLEPLGPTSLDEAREFFRQQITALVEGGVDLIVIETMVDLQEARQALLAAREVCALPVVVQMTIQEDGSSPTGTQPEDFTRQLDAWGADVIGLNCSLGPAGVLETLERMAKVTARKLSAQPNAGLPRTVEGRSLYLCSPEYMASHAQRFIQAGARLVGGCCGTTPEHIGAIKAAVRSLNLGPRRKALEVSSPPVEAMTAVALERRSKLAEKLVRREFPILIEVVPPKGCDPTREVEGAEYLRGQGADAVNIPDGAGSTARMSAQTLAAIIQQRVGVEVLLHYSCLDRNVLSIQSDLLGAYALGLRNILAVTGHPPALGTYPAATAVRDLDSIGLVNVLNNLNRGLDAGGNPMGTQTGFLIGVEADPYALDPEDELRRFQYKVEAGANFAVTQPVFDPEPLSRFLERLDAVGIRRIPILAGIYPLTSYRNAEFLNNEVPGVSVPGAVMERMRQAGTGDKARSEGARIAQELLIAVRDLVQGAQISAPFGRYALAVEVAGVLHQRAGV
ncbi:MAG TPA: bifunctional homocysteine S-methyltransferase/methylenetetrahydrofolate reductase [Terriglobia bacterium]|nr:bifunctional homocysteine S-methyltransferase/methylenetetrahydrofolate reductase [Terriglobia bacterium]